MRAVSRFAIASGLCLAAQLTSLTSASAQCFNLLPASAMLAQHIAPTRAFHTTSADASRPRERGRDITLPILYGSFVALQVADLHSTQAATSRGYTESNPVMRTRLPGALAIKAGTTVATIWFVERLARGNRAAAIMTMIGVNAGYVLIAHSNYRRAQSASPR